MSRQSTKTPHPDPLPAKPGRRRKKSRTSVLPSSQGTMIMHFRSVHTFAMPAIAALLLCGSHLNADVPFPSFPRADSNNNFQKMRIGELNVKTKPEYAEAYADWASWLADRLAHPPFNGEEYKGKPMMPPESIETLLEEVELRCCVIPKR